MFSFLSVTRSCRRISQTRQRHAWNDSFIQDLNCYAVDLFFTWKLVSRISSFTWQVADSYENAREAASKVKIDVEEEEGCLYTIDEAIAKESFADLGFVFAPMAVASIGEDLVKGDHRIENGEVSSS